MAAPSGVVAFMTMRIRVRVRPRRPAGIRDSRSTCDDTVIGRGLFGSRG